jgi:hypothetical protein
MALSRRYRAAADSLGLRVEDLLDRLEPTSSGSVIGVSIVVLVDDMSVLYGEVLS